MIEQGDICIANLNAERRVLVLVISTKRFAELAGRALVAPEASGEADIRPPWRVTVDDRTFALDHLRSVHRDRLLERVDRAPHAAVAEVRRALRHIS